MHHIKETDMPRQSITLTPPNEAWLAEQVSSEEYASKSEVMNALIRQARRDEENIEAIRAALIEGEESGRSTRTPEDIRNDVVERLRNNGQILSQ